MVIVNVMKRTCFLFQVKQHYHVYGYYHKYQKLFNITSNVRNSHTGVRVRFAPSPTGMLHLGGLRTALCNYAFARTHKGKFILRIEDTDRVRLVPSALKKLQEILCWIGLPPDEGPLNGGEFGPYIQSQRLHLYNERIKILLENNSAYYCFCSERRLALIRKEAARRREKAGYDNHCRSLTTAEVEQKLSEKIPYTIRFKVPNELVTLEDLVYEPKTLNLSELEGDPILMKSDGFPTYHFSNVIDDHEMKITHVLRGSEWHLTTVKHILLYKALGYETPQFAHLPLLLNSEGNKLSKRQGNIAIEDYKIKGYFPEAILNFVASRGGGFKCEEDQVKSIEELINSFSIHDVNKHSSKVDYQALDDYNRIFIQQQLDNSQGKKLLISQLRSLILNKFKDMMSETQLQRIHQDEYLNKVLYWNAPCIITLEDLLKEEFEFFWIPPQTFDLSSISITNKFAAYQNFFRCHILPSGGIFYRLSFFQPLANILRDLHAALKDEFNDSFSHKALAKFLRKFSQKQKMAHKTLMMLLRIVLANFKDGLKIGELIDVMGKESTLERLDHAQQWLMKNQLKEKNTS